MNSRFKTIRLQALAMAIAGLAMTAAADRAAAGPPPQTSVVTIGNFTFAQPTLTVRRGMTVTWVNDDDVPHTVVAKNLAFRSKVLDTGDRFSVTFAKAGQFDYFCSLHPHMTGRIIVKA
jgi:plastocyanin